MASLPPSIQIFETVHEHRPPFRSSSLSAPIRQTRITRNITWEQAISSAVDHLTTHKTLLIYFDKLDHSVTLRMPIPAPPEVEVELFSKKVTICGYPAAMGFLSNTLLGLGQVTGTATQTGEALKSSASLTRHLPRILRYTLITYRQV